MRVGIIAVVVCLALSAILPAASAQTVVYTAKWASLGPIDCQGSHVPIHCPIGGNHSIVTPAGRASFSFRISGVSTGIPHVVVDNATLDVTLTYDGPVGGAAINMSVSTEDIGGLHFTSTTNQTKLVSPGVPSMVSFPYELTPGWPYGDWIWPSFRLGADDLWEPHYLAFAVGGVASPSVPTPTPPTPIASPEGESTSFLPVGPLALAALAAAAVLVARRKRN